MKKVFAIAGAVVLAAGMAVAADQTGDKVLDRVNAAGTVLEEIMAAPDKGIPEEILSSADCVAIVPSMKNGGFVVGARYGRGVATCRNGASWSAPAPFVLEGGSWGLQIGGQAIDLVMLVMNQHGMTQLLNSKFKVGADASAAAGPVGRHAEGSTDWKLRSEILTYSRARGAFAGITLNGAVVKQDDDSTQQLYGRVIPFKQILTGNVPAPAGAKTFLANVAKYFHAARTADQNASATRVNEASSPSTATTGGASGTASSSSSPNSTAATPAPGSVSSNAGGTSSTSAPSTSSTEPATTSPATSTTSTTDTSSTAAGATGTASSAPNSAASAGASQLSNSDIKDLIERALRNEPRLSSSNVNVVVSQDAVQLSGTVSNQTEKDTIRRIAEQNAGNRKVSDADLAVK